jgi:5-methylcytosine-specific restriction protein A
MSGQWEGSDRKATLPDDWPQRRAAVWQRDGGVCQWPDEHGICAQPGTDVDHIGDGDNHGLDNLQLLCGWHHDRKSSRQGNAARWAHRMQRPPEAHPGLIT